MKTLLLLFFEFFRLSLFVIGGGYAILSVADDVFARRRWTGEGEIVDQLSVFQMLPGLIATHTAVYVGRKMAGLRGALVAVFATALPSILIFTLVARGYQSMPVDNPHALAAFTGLRATLVGVIASTLVRSVRRTFKDRFSILLAALAFLSLFVLPVYAVIVAAICIGMFQDRLEHPRQDGAARVLAASWLPLLLFAEYGLLGFGGGFVLVPMYLADFVGESATYLQLPERVFANVMALSQMTPGPIGVNCATFFGYRLAGVIGALIASFLLLFPGDALTFLAFRSLDRFSASPVVRGIMRGVRPASVSLMLVAFGAFARMACWRETADGASVDALAVALCAVTAVLAYRRTVSVVRLILATAAFSWLVRGILTWL